MNEVHIFIREASRQSLITFVERAMLLMIAGYVHFQYVTFLAAKIEDYLSPPRAGRLAINLPPRHGKSFILIIVAAWYLGKYPEKEVLLVTHSQPLANDLASKLDRLLKSSFFKETFPAFQFMEGRETMADFRTSKGGSFKAAGIETNVTGRGADLILIDDALSAQDANSPTMRNAVRDSYDNMIATRINDPKTGTIISMSHRLHEDDPTGHFIKRGFDLLKLPFSATEDEDYTCRGVGFKRKVGEVLQPGRSSAEDVNKLGLTSYVYLTQYQQNPSAIGSGFLGTRHFPTVSSCPSGGETIISRDTASSLKDRSSYSVALVFQVIGNMAYLKHIQRDRLDYSQLKICALDLHIKFKPKHHLIEKASLGEALASDLRDVGASVFEISTRSLSKEVRLSEVLNRLEDYSVSPVEGISNLQEFLDECTSFPNGMNDDCIDALTQFLKWWQENPTKPKQTPVTLGAGQKRLPPARTERRRR